MHGARPLARRMTAVVATVTLAAALAGCSPAASTPSAASVAPAGSAAAPAGSTEAPPTATIAPTATSSEPFTISVAFGSTGDAVDGIFTELKTAYEAKYPGRTVEIIVQ